MVKGTKARRRSKHGGDTPEHEIIEGLDHINALLDSSDFVRLMALSALAHSMDLGITKPGEDQAL